jgi:hypothetical protein
VTFPPKCKVPDEALAAVDPQDFLKDYEPSVSLTNGRIPVGQPVPIAR